MRRMFDSPQRMALLCLLLSAAISIGWGSVIAVASSSGMGAFKAIFYGTRSLMRHSDPYDPAVLQNVYQSEGGQYPSNAGDDFLFRRAMLVCVNLPTSLFLIAPYAVLPWKTAAPIWMAQNIAGLFAAAFLMWIVAKECALKPATVLICLLLANSELLLGLANLSAIVISLCVISVWCFLEERFVRVGVFCLAISLAFKPQIAGLVWLYFLIAGGVYRRRALQTLAIVAVLTLPAVFWTSRVAPQWPKELRANLHTLSARGSVNDPGPSSLTFHSADTVISLQSTFALLRDQSGFYNFASILTCGLLLLAGAIRTLKSRVTKENAWIALAAVASLSMLPVYHRTYDAKLLLLVIPACALLWREGGGLKWLAGLVTTLAIASTSDVPSSILLTSMKSIKDIDSMQGRWLTAFVFHPAPLILLATGSFYLCMYFRRTDRERRGNDDVCKEYNAFAAADNSGAA